MSSSSTARARIGLLPTELQCEIMKQISSPRALHALVNASSQYFRVYKVFEASILPEILRNAIPPALLPIALKAHALRGKCEQKRDEGPDLDAVAAHTDECILQGRSDRVEWRDKLPFETSKALLQFHEAVEYFVSAFTRTRLTRIQQILPLNKPLPPDNKSDANFSGKLSQTENFRLVRAFYYLEIIHRLFTTAYEPGVSPETFVRDQCMPFLKQLPDFEFEELLCVQRFLADKVHTRMHQLEDDYINAYVEKKLRTAELRKLPIQFGIEDLLSLRDPHGQISAFSPHGFSAPSLSELRTALTTGTLDHRLYCLRFQFSPEGIWASLPRLSVNFVRPTWSILDRERPIHSAFVDRVDKGNFGWLWLQGQIGRPGRDGWGHVAHHEAARQWDFAIWDYDRVLSFGILTEEYATKGVAEMVNESGKRASVLERGKGRNILLEVSTRIRELQQESRSSIPPLPMPNGRFPAPTTRKVRRPD